MKYFNASCELHRPAFMTLEPIRWQLRSWELMSILNRWLCKLSGKQMSNMAHSISVSVRSIIPHKKNVHWIVPSQFHINYCFKLEGSMEYWILDPSGSWDISIFEMAILLFLKILTILFLGGLNLVLKNWFVYQKGIRWGWVFSNYWK